MKMSPRFLPRGGRLSTVRLLNWIDPSGATTRVPYLLDTDVISAALRRQARLPEVMDHGTPIVGRTDPSALCLALQLVPLRASP